MKKRQIQLNDYDVLGVGAEVRQKLLSTPAEYILLRHEHSFLPGVLESTLVWLNPVQILNNGRLSKEKVLNTYFQEIFKSGIIYFGESIQKVFKDYLQEMPWEEGLARDHFRYFPEFVRRRFSDISYYEILQWEWIQNYLSYVDLGDFSKAEPEIIKISPSLMITTLSEAAASVLNKKDGLYACVFSSRKNSVVEKLLQYNEAEILDLLSEDRKYSRMQLIEMFQDSISSALDSLQQSDIISR